MVDRERWSSLYKVKNIRGRTLGYATTSNSYSLGMNTRNEEYVSNMQLQDMRKDVFVYERI